MDYDVLVVGAGPAGSGAARSSAMNGAKTLMIDKKKEIGTPVQCGEVIGLELVKRSGMRLPPQAVVARHSFTRFVLGREAVIDNHEPYWRSVTVERKIFDKHLAERAAPSRSIGPGGHQAHLRPGEGWFGSELRHQSPRAGGRAVPQGHRGRGRRAFHHVQGAGGGVLLPYGRSQGRSSSRWWPRRTCRECMQIFIEGEIGLGYGWIIPKGRRRANVGLGLVGVNASRRTFLEDWISEHPVVSRYFDVDKVLEVKMGDAPVPGFLGGPVKGNVLFCGDAAGQTLAFVGEGIMPSYICGGLAGKHAALMAQGKEQRYEEELVESMGGQLMMGAVLRDTLVELWSSETLDLRMRSLLSGAVMNELVSPDDMMHSLSALEREPVKAIQSLIEGSGRSIRARRC